MIILKITKNQGFTLSLEDILLEKAQGEGGRGFNLNPQSAVLELISCIDKFCY